MEPIIKSILDTDLYKLTMQMAVVKKFPRAKARYAFINRGNTQFPDGFGEELRKQIKHMEELSLSKDEKEFLRENADYFDPTYLDFLYGYRFNSSEVGIIQKEGDLEVYPEGYWHRSILWEVPVMAIISELYFKMTGQEPYDEGKREQNNLNKKNRLKLNGVKYADFGTRRRFSYKVQDELVKLFAGRRSDGSFVGTSNVHLAQKYNTKMIGTHAHEWFMFHGAKYGFKMGNELSLEHWVDVFRGDLGIALPDTFTTDAFFKVFDKKFSKLFDGVRHDSDNFFDFTDKTINHYNKLNIDPLTKTIVYSDGLTTDTAIEATNYSRGKIKSSCGIGTHFTNDVGVKPLNIVIKMVDAKPEDSNGWIPTIKLSDVSGKNTGDKKMIENCKYVLNIK